jgi:hypothetical protein
VSAAITFAAALVAVVLVRTSPESERSQLAEVTA